MCHLVDFAIPVNHRDKEREKANKYLDLGSQVKKTSNGKTKMILVVVGTLVKETEQTEDLRKNRYHSDHSTV